MRESAIADLARSGITAADAEAAGMFDVDNASTIYPDFKPEPAIVIPYYDPGRRMVTFGAEHKLFCRIRYLTPRVDKLTFANRGKILRYTQPEASGIHAYFPMTGDVDWQRISEDAAEPVIITEGEKKSLAATLAGFPVIGLGGVFNFADKSGALIPELADMEWKGRDTYICFDSDATLNPNILAAEARLVDELQRKRGARCYLVRLPQSGESKVGLDDYLLSHGAQGFVALLQSAPSLGALDAKVVALNKSVAWIERENLVYDLETRLFVPKDSFVNGSRFSSLKHITTGGKQRSAPKEISVAATWLQHPHAQRFSEVLFRPNEGTVVTGDFGRPALNLWNGWDAGEGDVQPFLDLTSFLFRGLRDEHRDLPLKLMAYKTQNPQEKIPLAMVLLGTQGCGKTLWSECLVAAFSPYSTVVTSKSFYSEFQGWMETALFAVITEAESEDMKKGGDILKSLISDLQRPMNEKFRPARQINSYTMYVITSNKRAVGAFAPDDRRMIVVDCPPASSHGSLAEQFAYYDRVRAWKAAGGGKALLGYLLSYDLQGWRPPSRAPMTPEKYMAYIESLTPIQKLAEDMRTASDQTVKLWLDQAVAWAQIAELSSNPAMVNMGRATLDNVRHFEIRPWYTPEELALIFPHVVQQLLGSRMDSRMPAGKISAELREAGVPYLQCADDPRGFKFRGQVKQYLVVADFDEWRQPIRQDYFEQRMQHWPKYGSMMKRGAL